jgi:hypothetical membrane protein
VVKLILLLGPILFVVISLILGKITPRYNWKDNYISELAIGKYGIIQRLNFFACGISITGLSLFLSLETNNPSVKLAWGFGLLLGITIILAGVWNTDTKEGPKTKSGILHNWTYYIGTLGASLAILLVGWGYRTNLTILILSWAVAILHFIIWLCYKKSCIREGLAQRVVVFSRMLWIELIAIWSFQLG